MKQIIAPTHLQESRSSATNDRAGQAADRPGRREFADNRSSSAAQRALADLVARSPRVTAQLARAEAIGHAGPRRAGPGELPDALRAGVERLSGIDMSHVRVHRNSDRPAQLDAHAYAQGADIYLAPGQERHLPHEAWHVVQQAQGRVASTVQVKGMALNDNETLEREADVMGAAAVADIPDRSVHAGPLQAPSASGPVQRRRIALQYDWKRDRDGVQVQERGGLHGELDQIAARGGDWFATFPAAFYPAMYSYLDGLAAYTPEDAGHIRTIMGKIAPIHPPAAGYASSGFTQAPSGKQSVAMASTFAEAQDLVQRISGPDYHSHSAGFEQGQYGRLIAGFNLADISGYTKSTRIYKEFASPFLAIPSAVKHENAELTAEIGLLFAWYAPFALKRCKGHINLASVTTCLETLLASRIEKLKNMTQGGAALPREALLNQHTPRAIAGDLGTFQLGVGSGIVTSKYGALKSGEKAEGRVLETLLTERSHDTYVAGHIVAGSIGGKFAGANYNLTPLTNDFNTGPHGMQAPEHDARTRLSANQVIHYYGRVSYGNPGPDWHTYLPTHIGISLSTMKPRPGTDASDIASYTVSENTKHYPLPVPVAF